MADPFLALRAEEAAQRPREKSPGERLLADVGAVAAIARRAKRLADEQRAKGAKGLFTPALGRVVEAARADTEALFVTVQTEVAHAG